MENREIDRLIAEKVMGWHLKKTSAADFWVGEHDGEKGDWTLTQMWKPSRDMRDAWEVVEKLEPEFNLCRDNNTGIWIASIGFFGDECSECGFEEFEVAYQGSSISTPLAICLAALKSVGVEVGG